MNFFNLGYNLQRLKKTFVLTGTMKITRGMKRFVSTAFILIIFFSQARALSSPLQILLLNVEANTPYRPFLSISNHTYLLDSLPLSKTLQNVLFATNEDCDLSIYGEFNGVVTKSEHLRLQLAPGLYTFKAASRSSADELEQNFTVRDTGLNEIFIDLLYVSNQNKQAEADKQKVQRPVPPNKKTQIEQEPNIVISSEPEVVLNNILENMVPINGGSFIMGNNQAPSEDEAEHTVTIKSVLFSRYEVTQGQWQVIMGNNPSINKGCNNCPVENVSWEEAMKFIKKVNVLSDKTFRLPTEAEWEYVARFGGKEEIEQAGGPEEFIKSTAWYFANSDKKTHPVGQLKPNAAGIYDLYGNVSEWCSDWYSPQYFKEENQKDPAGPPLGKEKVIRGGSYVEYSADRFRPSLRNKLKPLTKDKSIGFRMVLDAD